MDHHFPTSLKYMNMKANSVTSVRLPKTVYLVVVVLLIGIGLTFLNVYELRKLQRNHYEKDHVAYSAAAYVEADHGKKTPTLWVKAKNAESGYLNHVFKVFQRLGFTVQTKDEPPETWDVLWHHDYPFLDEPMRAVLTNLQYHQKVNHIPGSGFYTSKVNLATSNISGIPRAFKLPTERQAFVEFSSANPEKFWVQKSNRHRGIKILKADELDLSLENSFVQEYIAKPLLIDGRKFDIGIYTIVTSVKPLRVYVYEGEALLRFCPKDYYPFDAADVDKYVVGDDYTPTWEIPSLAKYYRDGENTHKQSLNAYVRSKGENPDRIWSQIRNTISEVIRSKEPQLLDLTERYKHNGRNFFELSRFDFVLDEFLNVFLMEANMSPNLSSGHFPPNKLLYEQVLFNLLAVVGVARQVHAESLKERSIDEEQMLVSDKDLSVYADVCAGSMCHQQCAELKCKLCSRCLSIDHRLMLRNAYAEHVNRANTRRVLPAPVISQWLKSERAFEEHLQTMLTDDDRFVALWFRGKCMQDATWCS